MFPCQNRFKRHRGAPDAQLPHVRWLALTDQLHAPPVVISAGMRIRASQATIPIMRAKGAMGGVLPSPPLTRDDPACWRPYALSGRRLATVAPTPYAAF